MEGKGRNRTSLVVASDCSVNICPVVGARVAASGGLGLVSLCVLHGSVHIIGIGGNFLETGVKAKSQSAAIGHVPELDALPSYTGPSEAGAQLKKKKKERERE